MRCSNGLLALTLAATCGLAPAAAIGNFPTPADDLTWLEGLHPKATEGAVTHFSPNDVVHIQEDSDLAGTWVVEAFVLEADATVVATSDLTIIARSLIDIRGQLFGAHSAAGGVSIVLRSFDELHIDGVVQAGDSTDCNHAGSKKAAPGGELWIAGQRGTASGFLRSGDGGNGGQGQNGGDGGHAYLIGGIYGTSAGIAAPNLLAGHGGNGGSSAASPGRARDILAGNGGHGGDSMVLESASSKLLHGRSVPSCVRSTSFGAVALRLAPTLQFTPGAPPVSVVASTIAASCLSEDPIPVNCLDGRGETGDDGTVGSETVGTTPAQMASPTLCCQEGAAATVKGGSARGGNGGHGGQGHDSTNIFGADGGAGGRGGNGGDGYGGTGQRGADATDCCNSAGDGCGAAFSKIGGAGADGGKGAGGHGGGGGYGGNPTGDCVRGPSGEGGNGGNEIGGNGGRGGDAGGSIWGRTDPEVGAPGGDGDYPMNDDGAGRPGLDGWNGNPAASGGANGYLLDLILYPIYWTTSGIGGTSTPGEDGEAGSTGHTC